MLKTKERGFTLIELLVVVAIIGILAAVGTVAYTGYTASAKKSAAKSNHANVVKYVAAEMAKCNIDAEAFDGFLCTAKSAIAAGSTANPAEAAALALNDFKDPYGGAAAAVQGKPFPLLTDLAATAGALSSTKGITLISTNGADMQVSTCVADACSGDNLMSNAVAID